ncbi:integrase [cyanobiont of Ornithocercus magnificus]|nr:integrase [cyanobiont of Ornithocercus magnificus]
MTIAPLGTGISVAMSTVFAGMDKADALAFVSRMFDAATAGDDIWTDDEIIERFLQQCSRTGSRETRDGYARELYAFRSWLKARSRTAGLSLVTPQVAEDWVAFERAAVERGDRQPRSFNRRIAAVSALFRWASEPKRSSSTGIVRCPLPRRQMLEVVKQPRPLTYADLDRIIEAITLAGHQRDLVLVKGAYLVGCRVSELAALRWRDVEAVGDGGLIHLIGKGSKPRTVRVSDATLKLFNSIRPIGIDELAWVFPSSRCGKGHLTRQGIGSRVRYWGYVALGNGTRVWPQRLRTSHATHAIRNGVDIFTLQATLGHSSTSTTQDYVAVSPDNSSSLKLG